MILTGKRIAKYVQEMEPKRRAVLRNTVITVTLWLLCLVLVLTGNPLREMLLFMGLILPCALVFHTISFYSFLPKAHRKKRPFLSYSLRFAGLLIAGFVPFVVLAFLFLNDADASITYAVLNSFFQLLIAFPLSWFVYKHQTKVDETILVLKKELGRSAASLDFLRSQINPHFLFNALNTLYGTALQEKAERTSEGIQMLGDMMRFMMQENLQEKIPLLREIDYLNNYISLQRLRTDPAPTIRIETFIEEAGSQVDIAPMLLIPFVENAFKHGISFREPSYIKITLEVKENILHFDVSNSRHARHEANPEKHKSGIGLDNVKQRLELLYRNRHELVIRESARDFFIHLSLKLSPEP